MNGSIGSGAGLAGSYGPDPSAKPITKTLNLNSAPDYASLIQNDPAYKQLKDLLSAQGIGDAAHLRGALQQALIQFGAVPNLPSDVLNNSGLDTGLTKNLAENNPFSILKRLAQSYQDSQDATKNQLAARGILSSGETGYQLGRLGHDQAQNQYDATNSLLGNIGSLNDAYAAGQQAHAQQLAQGAFTAEANQANSGVGGQSITATYNPQTGTWVDPTGNHYDQNGNPITLPSQRAPVTYASAGATPQAIPSQAQSPITSDQVAAPVAFGGTPTPKLPDASTLAQLFRTAGGGPRVD